MAALPSGVLRDANQLVDTGKATTQMWENITSQATLGYVKPGMVCIDVGAHLGWYTALCARLAGPTGLVIAFEPLPDKAEFCRCVAFHTQHDERCAPVHIIQSGVGDRENYRAVEKGEAWSLCDVEKTPNVESSKIAVIRNTTLDGYFRNIAAKSVFLKIDVDGYETPVIFGGTSFISAKKPVILLECGPYYAKLMGYDFRKPLDFLEKIGYRFIADHG